MVIGERPQKEGDQENDARPAGVLIQGVGDDGEGGDHKGKDRDHWMQRRAEVLARGAGAAADEDRDGDQKIVGHIARDQDYQGFLADQADQGRANDQKGGGYEGRIQAGVKSREDAGDRRRPDAVAARGVEIAAVGHHRRHQGVEDRRGDAQADNLGNHRTGGELEEGRHRGLGPQHRRKIPGAHQHQDHRAGDGYAGDGAGPGHHPADFAPDVLHLLGEIEAPARAAAGPES